jgi:hypothetical protein
VKEYKLKNGPDSELMTSGDEKPDNKSVEAQPASVLMLERDSSLGPFKSLRFVGVGGIGSVYQAWDEENNTHVAIKTLV